MSDKETKKSVIKTYIKNLNKLILAEEKDEELVGMYLNHYCVILEAGGKDAHSVIELLLEEEDVAHKNKD